jgi:hypothetical protein
MRSLNWYREDYTTGVRGQISEDRGNQYICDNHLVAGCAKCEGFSERLNLEHPHEYQAIAQQLIEVVEQGTFVIVRATCPLKELFGPQWPGDVIEHEFRCVTCGRRYELSADTYHGHASWSPVAH